MANRNWSSGGKIYSMITSPVLVVTTFTVDDTDPSGITSLKGPTVSDVLMHSVAATPSSPNPAAGTILVQLADNYNEMIASVKGSIISPNSGSDITSTTAGVAVTITSVGTTTAAQFQAKGLPRGITPAVGVSFVPTASGALGGTGTIQITAAAGSGIATVELVSDPNNTVSPTASANQGYGAYMILQCRDYAGAIAAPAAGSIIQLSFIMNNSSVRVQGE